MERKIITTGDGSKTIQIVDWDEQYHSTHGAVQEAQHVFLKMGLDHLLAHNPHRLRILEIGFGTGLNAYLTCLQMLDYTINVDYTGVEAFPVTSQEVEAMDYPEATETTAYKHLYDRMHDCEWGSPVQIADTFELIKQQKTFDQIDDISSYDLIYFDAFGPRVQPELWSEQIFQKMYTALSAGGVLTTYSAKGAVRRAMQAVGFTVERLPGPPGKREMLRATKSLQ